MPLQAYYIVGAALICLAAFVLMRIPREVGATVSPQPRILLRRRYWLYYVLTLLEGSRKQVLGTFGSLVLVEMYGFQVWQVSLVLLAGHQSMVCAPTWPPVVRMERRRAAGRSYVGWWLAAWGTTPR
jgi:predicted MFS family arabinose efflux permease